MTQSAKGAILKSAILAAGAAASLFLLPAAAQAAGGSQVWSQAGCGGCHTLQAAGSAGTAGPNLDYLRPSAGTVAAQVASGGGGMPSFSGSLSNSEIQSVATWVASVAGQSSSSGSTTLTPSAGVAGLSASAVDRIQRELSRLGFFHHAITGFYGPVTTAAVKRFQRSVGLHPDGIWGPKTAAALKRHQ
jgi:mono/diheme cytochrome c family protein